MPSMKGIESSTFYFNAIKDWNGLPTELKNCEHLNSFKKGVKKYLLHSTATGAEREYVFFEDK